MTNPLCRAALLLLAVLCTPNALCAQPNKKKQAVTDPAKADADFAYQGEFLGVFIEGKDGKQVGLQVVAQGDGEFLGVEYSGGLPGTGWNRKYRLESEGSIESGYIFFRNEKHQFYVSPKKAHIYDPHGEPLGELPRVERVSPTMGIQPPQNALVLFNGKDNGQLVKPRITPEGLLTEGPREGTLTKKAFADFSLHIEFMLPYMPYARDQGRANSGVYLQSRYEVQILDSFGLKGLHNECGGLYRQRPPNMNMCLPPLQWQTYDITLKSAEFDAQGKKTRNAHIIVRHNGILIHDTELTRKTGAGKPEGPNPLPTKLQNHGNPVRFRNIWIIEHKKDRAKPLATSR